MKVLTSAVVLRGRYRPYKWPMKFRELRPLARKVEADAPVKRYNTVGKQREWLGPSGPNSQHGTTLLDENSLNISRGLAKLVVR